MPTNSFQWIRIETQNNEKSNNLFADFSTDQIKTRQPAITVFFRLSFSIKMTFQRWKHSHFWKHYLQKFQFSQLWKKFRVFRQKKPHSQGGKYHFEKLKHLIHILQQICRLEQFWKTQCFSEKPMFFQKVAQNLTSSVTFNGNFDLIWWNFSWPEIIRLVVEQRTSSIGEHWVTKSLALSGWFYLHIIDMGGK